MNHHSRTFTCKPSGLMWALWLNLLFRWREVLTWTKTINATPRSHREKYTNNRFDKKNTRVHCRSSASSSLGHSRHPASKTTVRGKAKLLLYIFLRDLLWGLSLTINELCFIIACYQTTIQPREPSKKFPPFGVCAKMVKLSRCLTSWTKFLKISQKSLQVSTLWHLCVRFMFQRISVLPT